MIETIYKIQRVFIGIALGACVIMLCFNITLRLFDNSTTWSEEAIRFTMVWITFISMSIGFKRSIHYGIDVIQRVPNPTFKKGVLLFTLLCAILFSVCLVYYGSRLTLFTINSGQISASLELPMWVVYLAVPLGGLLNIMEISKLMLDMIANRGQESKAW